MQLTNTYIKGIRNFSYFLLLVIFISCSSKGIYKVTTIEGSYIPVNGTGRPDPETEKWLASYQAIVNQMMSEITGYAAQDMYAEKPESALTNFTSDAMKEFSGKAGLSTPVDIAIMNIHGHRAPIYRGAITVGDLYNTYPFENELVLLDIEGMYLKKVLEEYAKAGGGGISGNVRLTIKDNRLTKALINHQPIEDDRVYTLITLDYLAEGNDGMEALIYASSLTPTNMLLRDYITGYIKEKARHGKEIHAAIDGRITIQ